MESKGVAAAGARDAEDVRGAAPDEAGEGGAAGAEGSCCVLETVVREGRVETVCVATCCGADEAA
jgi:hypothetical protein